MSWSRQVDNVSSFDDNCGTKELLDLRLWSTGGHRKSRTYRMISNISGRAFSRSFILSFMAATMALALSSAPCLLLFSAAPRRQNKYFLIAQACHKLATSLPQEGFDQHFQATVHFHLTSTSATSIIFPMKIFGNAGIQNPGLLGEKQVCYLCALQPPYKINGYF